MSALARRGFRRLLLGTSLSYFGDSALYLSLGIWAKNLTGSNAAAGAIFLAMGLPALAAPAAGHWVDRVRRKPLLIGLNAATGVAVLSLLFVRSESQLWIMYAFAAFYGTTSMIIGPAMSGVLKDMLSDGELASANAAFSTVSQGLRIASPLAGAALYADFGGGSLAVADAVTFAFAVIMLASLRITESEIPVADRAPPRDLLLAGARYIRDTAVLRQMITSAVIAMLVLGFYESLTFAVISALGKPPSFFGVLMSVQGSGSIAGGLIAGRLFRQAGAPRTLGIALTLWAVASLIYMVPVMAVALGALFIFGMAVPIYAVAIGTATQLLAPPRMQGRVGATVSMLTNLSQTLSIAVGAALVDTIGYRPLLLIVTIVASAAAMPVLARPEKDPSLSAAGGWVAPSG